MVKHQRSPLKILFYELAPFSQRGPRFWHQDVRAGTVLWPSDFPDFGSKSAVVKAKWCIVISEDSVSLEVLP